MVEQSGAYDSQKKLPERESKHKSTCIVVLLSNEILSLTTLLLITCTYTNIYIK